MHGLFHPNLMQQSCGTDNLIAPPSETMTERDTLDPENDYFYAQETFPETFLRPHAPLSTLYIAARTRILVSCPDPPHV